MLPKELTAIIHHIELNKAGWWDKSVQQLLMFVIWSKNNKPLSSSDILNVLKDELKITLDNRRCQEQLDQLTKTNKMVRLGNGFKLSEATFTKIQKQIEETERIEQYVKNLFTSFVKELCPSLDPSQVWSDFNDTFLAPFVSKMGAYVFRLVTYGIQASELGQLAKDYFTEFTSKYPADTKSNLQEVASQFLNLQDPSVRSYILRMMNSYFYIEACGITQETLEKLIQLTRSKPTFNVFVDTNFLFSILNLHDNPSNEAAATLMELSKRLYHGVKVTFYVTPLTLDEAKRVIVNEESFLKGIRMTPNLLQATRSVRLSGIKQRFIESRAKDPSLDAESFFRPYINNLLSIARTKGIELYNERLDDYKKKQEVIDDILEQQSFEERQFGSDAKSYEALEHDMVLWHFVKDKRPSYVESPIEAKYWIVTVDYRFLGFDRYKTKDEQIAICIHPTALTQMLQFWVPRTNVLDEALLASLRLPLFFSEFDPEAEKVTIAILQTLSRFEDVADIPVETVANLLLNESLRARMRVTPQAEEQVQLIKEALIEEQARLKRELEESKSKLEERERETEKKEAIIRGLEEKLEHEKKSRQLIQEELQQARQEIKELQERMKVKEEEERRRQKEEKHRALRSFFIWWITLPFISLVIGSTIFVLAVGWVLRWLIIIDSLLLILWLGVIDYQAKKMSIKHLMEITSKIKRWIWRVLISGIIINALWELIKRLWS